MSLVPRTTLTDAEAEPLHLWIFGCVTAVLCAVGLVAFSFADHALSPQPAFLPAYASAVIVTDLITAYLIFAHAPLSGRHDLLWLGGGYLFLGAMVIAQMLVFPGVLSGQGFFGAGPQSAVWIWVLWHSGFPSFILVAMLAMWHGRRIRNSRVSRRQVALIAACVLLLVVAFEMLVTLGQGHLPDLIVKGDYHTLSQSWPGRMVVVLNAAALIAVLGVTRGRSVLGLGLSIAILALLIDTILTLAAGTRFSFGWYIARMTSVICAFSVLTVYLREATWLYARVATLNAHLARQATVDTLTTLYNRRHFDTQLSAALREGQRRGEPISLLMIDVDHFKRYNDFYGHPQGDDCLRQVAQAIAGAVRRPSDVAARYGGEEFAVILPGTPAEGSLRVARLMLAAVRALAIEHQASIAASTVTVSIGIATMGPGCRVEELIAAADRALYAAKAAGRDGLCHAADLAPEAEASPDRRGRD